MNKLHYYLLISIMFYFINGSSQDFGSYLYAGMNASQVDGDRNGGYHKFGPRFGFGITYPLSDKIDFGFELGYAQKGSRTEQDKNNSIPIIIYRYNYLEVPILLHYNLDKIRILAGPSINYLISAKADEGAGFNDMDGIKKIDVSGNLGVAYSLTDRLSVEGRYAYSLLNIIEGKDRNPTTFIRSGAFHNVFAISLNLKLN